VADRWWQTARPELPPCVHTGIHAGLGARSCPGSDQAPGRPDWKDFCFPENDRPRRKIPADPHRHPRTGRRRKQWGTGDIMHGPSDGR